MPHGFPGDRRDAPRGRAVPAGIQPVRRGEIRVRAQRPARAFIRSANASTLPATCSAIATAASFPLRSIRPVEHFLHGQLLALAQINRRARARPLAFFPAVTISSIAQLSIARSARHDLRGGGNRQPLVGILFKQHAPGFPLPAEWRRARLSAALPRSRLESAGIAPPPSKEKSVSNAPPPPLTVCERNNSILARLRGK